MSGKCSVIGAIYRLTRHTAHHKLFQCDTGIGEADWAFKNTFTVTEEDFTAANADLIFEGLDTFASITLASILSSVSKVFLTSIESERPTYPQVRRYVSNSVIHGFNHRLAPRTSSSHTGRL